MRRDPIRTFTNVIIVTGLVLLLMAMSVSDAVTAKDARPLGPVLTENAKPTLPESTDQKFRASQVLFWCGATLFVAGFVGRLWSAPRVPRDGAS